MSEPILQDDFDGVLLDDETGRVILTDDDQSAAAPIAYVAREIVMKVTPFSVQAVNRIRISVSVGS